MASRRKGRPGIPSFRRVYRHRDSRAISPRTNDFGERRAGRNSVGAERSAGMKAMITGAAGFIGGFLAKHCTDAGSQVLGIDIVEPQDPWAANEFELCD